MGVIDPEVGEKSMDASTQSQANGAQLAALSLQLQELISSVESRAEVVGRDLEEINGRFDHHRGEINRMKIREKDAKEETEQLKGYIVGAGCQGHSCPITSTERLYTVQVSTTRRSTKTKDSNDYLDTNV